MFSFFYIVEKFKRWYTNLFYTISTSRKKTKVKFLMRQIVIVTAMKQTWRDVFLKLINFNFLTISIHTLLSVILVNNPLSARIQVCFGRFIFTIKYACADVNIRGHHCLLCPLNSVCCHLSVPWCGSNFLHFWQLSFWLVNYFSCINFE